MAQAWLRRAALSDSEGFGRRCPRQRLGGVWHQTSQSSCLCGLCLAGREPRCECLYTLAPRGGRRQCLPPMWAPSLGSPELCPAAGCTERGGLWNRPCPLGALRFTCPLKTRPLEPLGAGCPSNRENHPLFKTQTQGDGPSRPLLSPSVQGPLPALVHPVLISSACSSAGCEPRPGPACGSGILGPA